MIATTNDLRPVVDSCEGDYQKVVDAINNIAPKDRDIAFVFQCYALYPHMSVYENIAFGLKMRKYPKNEIGLFLLNQFSFSPARGGKYFLRASYEKTDQMPATS